MLAASGGGVSHHLRNDPLRGREQMVDNKDPRLSIYSGDGRKLYTNSFELYQVMITHPAPNPLHFGRTRSTSCFL